MTVAQAMGGGLARCDQNVWSTALVTYMGSLASILLAWLDVQLPGRDRLVDLAVGRAHQRIHHCLGTDAVLGGNTGDRIARLEVSGQRPAGSARWSWH